MKIIDEKTLISKIMKIIEEKLEGAAAGPAAGDEAALGKRKLDG